MDFKITITDSKRFQEIRVTAPTADKANRLALNQAAEANPSPFPRGVGIWVHKTETITEED